MPSTVDLVDIRKSYGDAEIIKGADLTIDRGEFLVIVGPSGCGKSTLLRMIAGLEEITAGDLLFDGGRVNELSPAKRRVGMVFQSYALYPHMSVAENVSFGLKLAKKPKEEIDKRVNEALEVLQLDTLRDQKPSQLSGGQRQRVAIGRAIVRKPNVFLFDEPLSNLDTALRVQMRMEIGRLHRRLKNTVVYVTHDQVEAMTLADRIVVLEAGKIRQVGTPMELYNQPANKFVAGFIGSPKMGFINCKVRSKNVSGVTLRSWSEEVNDLTLKGFLVPEGGGEEIVIGLRPEHATITEPDVGWISGEILELERLGSDTYAYVDISNAEEPVSVRLRETDSVKPGDVVGINVDAEKCHLFDSNGEAVPQSQPHCSKVFNA